tara:strand:- start:2064 stop:2687 length:624 start_codon:yes stop_codon:yes gene_type:complete
MSNKTIQQMPLVTSVTATDVIPIVQNNVTSKILASKFEEKTQILVSSFNYNDQPFTAPNDVWQLVTYSSVDATGGGVTIKANGQVEITEFGVYTARVRLTVARQGSAGDGGACVIGIQPVQGGTAIDGITAVNLPNFASINPIELNIKLNVTTVNNSNFQVYILRDSAYSSGAGLTQGGLYNYDIGANGPGTSEPTTSATITISKVG